MVIKRTFLMNKAFDRRQHLQGNNFAKKLLYANSKTQASNKQLSKNIKYKYSQNNSVQKLP